MGQVDGHRGDPERRMVRQRIQGTSDDLPGRWTPWLPKGGKDA